MCQVTTNIFIMAVPAAGDCLIAYDCLIDISNTAHVFSTKNRALFQNTSLLFLHGAFLFVCRCKTNCKTRDCLFSWSISLSVFLSLGKVRWLPKTSPVQPGELISKIRFLFVFFTVELLSKTNLKLVIFCSPLLLD